MPPPTKDSVLDLEVRRRILEAAREHPGLHLRALAEMLGLPLSTLEYHCYQLVRHGHLTARQDAGFKAFYPSEGIDRRDKDILYVVRHEAPRRICAHLLLNPGATPKSLKEVTGLAGPTLSFHLKRLRDGGITREEPDGRTKRLYLVDAERVAGVLVTYRRSFLDEAVDRFAQAWLAFGRPAAAPAAEPPASPTSADPAPPAPASPAPAEPASSVPSAPARPAPMEGEAEEDRRPPEAVLRPAQGSDDEEGGRGPAPRARRREGRERPGGD